jgi:hypothetical protein
MCAARASASQRRVPERDGIADPSRTGAANSSTAAVARRRRLVEAGEHPTCVARPVSAADASIPWATVSRVPRLRPVARRERAVRRARQISAVMLANAFANLVAHVCSAARMVAEVPVGRAKQDEGALAGHAKRVRDVWTPLAFATPARTLQHAGPEGPFARCASRLRCASPDGVPVPPNAPASAADPTAAADPVVRVRAGKSATRAANAPFALRSAG